MENLIPSYLEADFQTSFKKLQNLLSKSNTFKDYNFQGSNITTIMQLLSYLSDFNNYYTNMVAKNVYADTADIYETVHRLVMQKGYQPLGYISSQVTCTITISGDSSILENGDQIYINSWQSIDTQESVNDNKIFYTLTDNFTTTVSSSGTFSFDIKLREGVIEELEYRGEDIIDNTIILPFKNFDHGKIPFDVPSILVTVNDIEWTRINDFYDDISGLGNNDNVYRFVYDKYERYGIQFSSSRNIPINTDEIKIYLLVSNNKDGVIASNVLTKEMYNGIDFKINNITKGITIQPENITNFTNNEPSIPGSLPETIDELKINAEASVHSQYRNVTKKDYKSYLESRTDVIKGYAWGEQETNPGNTLEYNKVYFSVIPPYGINTYFSNGTINTTSRTWHDSDTPSISGNIEIPSSYYTDFTDDLLKYLEVRKMINIYEVPVLPELIYFRFNIGIRIKRIYNFIEVKEDVKNKLNYFFDSSNRSYHETINFMDIINFITDQSITSTDDNFEKIKGIDHLTIREIKTYTPSIIGNEEQVYEPNTLFNYPQYTTNSYNNYIDNMLRPIELGFNQFPVLALEMCIFNNEI
jgi:hypothetical protein